MHDDAQKHQDLNRELERLREQEAQKADLLAKDDHDREDLVEWIGPMRTEKEIQATAEQRAGHRENERQAIHDTDLDAAFESLKTDKDRSQDISHD